MSKKKGGGRETRERERERKINLAIWISILLLETACIGGSSCRADLTTKAK